MVPPEIGNLFAVIARLTNYKPIITTTEYQIPKTKKSLTFPKAFAVSLTSW